MLSSEAPSNFICTHCMHRWALPDYLIVKYADNWLNDRDALGYSDDWLKAVGYTEGPPPPPAEPNVLAV